MPNPLPNVPGMILRAKAPRANGDDIEVWSYATPKSDLCVEWKNHTMVKDPKTGIKTNSFLSFSQVKTGEDPREELASDLSQKLEMPADAIEFDALFIPEGREDR